VGLSVLVELLLFLSQNHFCSEKSLAFDLLNMFRQLEKRGEKDVAAG
jgi:hypothetical protein